MALSKGSRLGLIVIVIGVLSQTVNPQTPDQSSPGDRWHQVSRSSRTQSREPRQYYTSQRTVSPGTSSADVEYFPGTYRRTTTTHNYGGRRPISSEQTYTYRQSGPIKTTIEHSYSNRRVSTSYGNVDSRWRDFVDAAIEGRNYVGSRESCPENEPCYPPTGDLMIGREKMLVASSTCGDNMIYCDHDVTNTTRADGPGVCRQTCSSNPRAPNYYGVENIIKQNTAQQMNKRWQSAPGQEEVTIQLNLEAEFQFTHLIMTFHTFRPKVMIIEKSIDHGATFKEIAYFAHDCREEFPSIPKGPKRKLTDVVCEEKYSQLIPKHDGKLLYSNLVPREEALKMSNLRELDEIIRVTNLRLRFLRLHKLGDDAIGDSEVLKQKYYYSIRSLIIRGTCSCYGHAGNCLPASNDTLVQNKVYSKCQCVHNTIGDHCKECKPLYRDLKWQRASKEFSSCKSCDCNDLADECVFDEERFIATGKKSGGRCINCRDHTSGDNCELCEEFYYRNPRGGLHERVCRRCECDQNGSQNGGRCIQYDDGIQRAGQCICKNNAHGPRCDLCKPGFWNLNASNDDGCEACKCDRRGIRMGSQGCDQVTGKCSCKENVVGQSCDECAPGHYGLEEGPTGCKPCDCDRGGAHNPDTCDVVTGNCDCKDGIEGRRCDQVKDGYFVALPDYLIHEAEIPVQQRDAKVVRRPHNAQSNMRDFTGVGYMDLGLAGMIEVNFPVIPWTGDYNILVRGDPRSHNQELEITLMRDVRLQPDGVCKRNGAQDEPRDMINLRTLDAAPVMRVCLEKDTGVTIRLESTATSEAQILVDSVVLVPSYEKLDVYPRNIPIDHVNYCVNHVERYGITNINEVCPKLLFSGGLAIWNRAFKCDCGAGTSSNVCDRIGGQCKCKMNVVGRQCSACDTTSYGLDTEAECKACNCNTEGSKSQFCNSRGKCDCIDGVFGDKCDRCKPGFWGTPRNCRPCECYNRAEICEPQTGVCINCQDNTAGDHCEKCLEGYYGDPLRGIPCNSCMCPGSAASGRNHATSCTLSSTNEMYCHCKPGYKTPKCEECDNNYFQDKHGCIPCECNGKIDLSLEGNCDPLTGKCLRCLHNSEGDQCELCKPGHWKNANNDCQECDCDSIGSVDSYCNQENGKCTCQPNVVGDRCSACAEGFYDFNSGKGCKACNCDVHGTVDAGVTCGHDGQCYCKPGRGGLRCNECSPGFYGDPASGCYRCDCDGYQGAIKGVCDARTGHCKCREGMAGPRCDQCARGYKGKAPLCEPCDPCFADWDKVIQDLDARTQNLTETARLIKQTGTSGIHREFKEIEGYLSQIKDILAKANIPGSDLSQRQNLLEQLKRMLDTIEGALAAAENKHQAVMADSIGLVSTAAKLDSDVQDLQAKVKKLEEDMTSLREQDVMGAFKLIQDNVKKAKEYQQDSYVARGMLDNSTALRNEASRLLDRQQSAFKNVYNRNEDLMKDLDAEIQNLERTIPEINRHLCDSETSVEGCKDKCGGVGCDECGENIGCGRAAVYQADIALKMAKELEKILKEKQSNATEMRDDVEEARSRANQANNKAIEAHASVLDAHTTASNSLDDLKKLLEEIETLLRKAVGTPGDIRRIAKDCLELKVELTPKEIEELSRTIEMTIQSLSNVGNILSETQEDKDRTIDLRNKASRIKDEAEKILSRAEAVGRLLEEAGRDQADARAINEQIRRELQNSNSEIADLQDRGTAVKQRSTDLFTKSSNLRDLLFTLNRNKTQAVLEAKDLQKEFNDAHKLAEDVHDLSEKLNQKYQQALSEISLKTSTGDAKEKEVEELRRRTNALYKDYNQIAADLQVIEDFYKEYEQMMDDQNEQIRQMMAEMDRYQAEIDKKAVDYQTCVAK